jgi:hypothetical protein
MWWWCKHGVFSSEGDFGYMILTLLVFARFKCLTPNVRQSNNEFEMTDANGDPCPYQILRSMGGLEKVWGLTK